MNRPLGLLALAFVLTACSPQASSETPPAKATPTAETAAPASLAEAQPEKSGPPATWQFADESAEVKLTIPDEVKAVPRLYARLRDGDVASLERFAKSARETRAEMAEADRDLESSRWAREISYDSPFATDRLFSLEGMDWSYEGGAHGNPGMMTVLWDKRRNRLVSPAALFRRGADMTALDRAVCDAINAAKRARSAENPRDAPMDPVSFEPPADGPGWTCPKALEVPLALAPGTVEGKAGGLVFLIGPYIVGPYSEGGYGVAVPLDAFAALLSPDWSDQFAGGLSPQTLTDYDAG